MNHYNMKYHNITTDDMKNGDGLRVVLWVSGCSHHCDGCHNPFTWDPNSGLEFTQETEDELMDKLNYPYISGLTLSGGDPFFHSNIVDIGKLIGKVKLNFPKKTIWVYTGFKYEDIYPNIKYFISNIDVIIDGRFVKDLADVKYKWAGSTNQRIIDVKKTIKTGEIVSYV